MIRVRNLGVLYLPMYKMIEEIVELHASGVTITIFAPMHFGGTLIVQPRLSQRYCNYIATRLESRSRVRLCTKLHLFASPSVNT